MAIVATVGDITLLLFFLYALGMCIREFVLHSRSVFQRDSSHKQDKQLLGDYKQ